MKIIGGLIGAQYSGRGETRLAAYPRVVIEKADGTVSIHSDKGFKPLNYMSTVFRKIEITDDKECELIWEFEGPKDERLVIKFYEIFNIVDFDLGERDPGFSAKDKTEAQLQDWLSENIESLDEDFTLVEREYQTGDGPVDLLVSKADGLVALEVKRVAYKISIEQVLRYVKALKEKHPTYQVTGAIAAIELKAGTVDLGERRGVKCYTVPENWESIVSKYKQNKTLKPS